MPSSPYRIYADPKNGPQTFAFELAALPGEVFKMVIPEWVSDDQEIMVHWEHQVPRWDFGDHYATWSDEISGKIRQCSTVLFKEEVIEARVELTNLSQRSWQRVNAFTCFAFYTAPLFDNPELDRMRFPVEGCWRTVAELFSQQSPGDGPYTFFQVAGGPDIHNLELVRHVGQTHPQIVDYGAGCVVSRDGRWIAGIGCANPAYVFCCSKEPCLHANPLYERIEPGQTAQASTFIHVFQGNVEDFARKVDLFTNVNPRSF